mmetsp:Transcript_23784/g.35411  ORF Transcript_23784/g.35411 Transcript_23784/m.35411 type:complete len:239 (+) Transcript_23784:65-781(+)
MRVSEAVLTAVLSAVCIHSASAFAPAPAAGIITSSSPRHRQTDNNIYCPPLQAGPPIISSWRYESSKGVITGVVSNHPTIKDGDKITTSPIKSDPSNINENLVVQTKSGSKYKLSNAAWGAPIPAVAEAKKKEMEAAAAAKKMAQKQPVSKAPSRQIQPAAAAAVKPKPAAAKPSEQKNRTSSTVKACQINLFTYRCYSRQERQISLGRETSTVFRSTSQNLGSLRIRPQSTRHPIRI